ncbi:ATP-binding cassette domain-containing protein [Streptomyces sp. FL07-04A]|uniref:ATP-binding cassette domain-containing protein n=1 Tax=Streptomyces sp. FL07-04A TaxID=3028658 RepID=UPI0029B87F1D|nr:ATP-binding cassette domain-containing protein [Streptomyces sp. FL07-04A]MDX3577734.1 ATP-binding cassette domain-containing protein [Streptomyces sp. FL07-04A]
MDGVGVAADGLGLRGPRGWAFRGVDVDAGPASLIAIEGPSGSGRTSLLLALTGRMKATEGTAAVGAARLPRQMAAVRRVSALAHVAGVTDLEPALTVGEHLRERALLQRRFDGSVRDLLRPRAEREARTTSRIDAALDAAGLDRESLPKGARTAVRDLERVEALRLSVALALIGRPRLLGVDDIDLKLTDAERTEVWALLRSLTEAGTTVVAVCGGEAPGDAVRVRTDTHADAEAGTGRDKGTDEGSGAGSEAGAAAEAPAEREGVHAPGGPEAGPAGTGQDDGHAAETAQGDSGARTEDDEDEDEEERTHAHAETGRA